MSPAQMPQQTRAHLNRTIRDLRARLLADIRAGADRDYAPGTPIDKAGLDLASRVRRQRLEAWLDEQVRTVAPPSDKRIDRRAWLAQTRERFLRETIKEAAYTFLHRLVILRRMEALGLSRPAVLKGGRRSEGYRQFKEFARALCDDESEGYGTLLELIWGELSLPLPGLFGDVGLTSLLPVPAHTLLHAVEALDHAELAPAWGDDTTLGWVYQYWNDPEREALDAKLEDRGKIAPHEIAAKTQMFTERYMVGWLLHNSLGQLWLAMCKKHGWTADVQARPRRAERGEAGDGGDDGALCVLDRLERRRAAWRRRREAGEVTPDALMPIEGELEAHWKYWVRQPMPDDAPGFAPDSLRDLKLLDPACGSGHFLVIAFDLLAALYREEARHRGEGWTDRQIAEWIIERNLHGVDLDPRAVQIAAAALWLKMRAFSSDASPTSMHLVACNLRIADLPQKDPAIAELKAEVQREAGLPGEVVDAILHALSGVDHLGSLLRIGDEVDKAVQAFEAQQTVPRRSQIGLFGQPQRQQLELDTHAQRQSVTEALERFLSRLPDHAALGLRLRGGQLRTGARLVRVLKEGRYDLVVGNPPYQGTSRMVDATYVAAAYPEGRADLYAAFMLRALELVKEGGTSALLTMRNWMFLSQYEWLRKRLLGGYDLRVLGDVDRGAFEEIPDEVVAATMSVVRRREPSGLSTVAMQPTPLDDRTRDSQRTNRKRAAVLAGVGRFEFDVGALKGIEGEPVVYWWDAGFLDAYCATDKLGESAPARNGMSTQDNTRFLRLVWEVRGEARLRWSDRSCASDSGAWVPYIKGASGREWFEDLHDLTRWAHNGLEPKVYTEMLYRSHSRTIKNEALYFQRGVAFAVIGAGFSARAHRFHSVFGHMGASVFPGGNQVPQVVTLLNSTKARRVLASLNPGVHFLASDVNRLPLFKIESADAIYAHLDTAFTEHESHREPSVEYRHPGPSCWTWAQDWAQRAVDRPSGAPLPPWTPVHEDPPPTDHVSFALGVAMGRFGAKGQGTLDARGRPCRITPPPLDAPPDAPAPAPPPADPVQQPVLPHGILYLSATGGDDGLAHPACAPLHAAWTAHGEAIAKGRTLRDWLQRAFFEAVHRKMYADRPIYLPLSSNKRTFVAWVSIHRFAAPDGAAQTLPALLADHLVPERRNLHGRLADALEQRQATDAPTRRDAERSHARLSAWLDELDAFIAAVTQLADNGPPPPDAKTPPREVDARFAMDLDDGVMVNAAALWPLLSPQWKKPRQWYKELATAKGRKDYDWSHLAARYFPARVEAKCSKDPSLAVAHGCFWRDHPARAFSWELRLQDEIGVDFVLEEPDSDACREGFMVEQTALALGLVGKEAVRRARKVKGKRKLARMAVPLGRLWEIAPGEVLALEKELRRKKSKRVALFDPRFVIVEPGCEGVRAGLMAKAGCQQGELGI